MFEKDKKEQKEKYDSPVILGASTPKAVVIWLHGLGADGEDFVPIVKELKKLSLNLNSVKFIFPHAPFRKITINNGATMRGWYDINNLSSLEREDEIGVRESVRYIHELMEKEHNAGIPYEKIVLAGFSQGGAIALYAALTLIEKIGGVIALSTYIPIVPKFEQDRTLESARTPILMVHGTMDSIIALDIAERSRQLLEKNHYSVNFVTYPMDHTVCEEEIKKIAEFLSQVI
jgi:phospholipase/carboxylesterase